MICNLSEENDKREFVPLPEIYTTREGKKVNLKKVLERIQNGEEEPPTLEDLQRKKAIEEELQNITDSQQYEEFLSKHPDIVDAIYEESQKEPQQKSVRQMQLNARKGASEKYYRSGTKAMHSAQQKLNQNVPSSHIFGQEEPYGEKRAFVPIKEIANAGLYAGRAIYNPSSQFNTALTNAERFANRQYHALKKMSGVPISQRSRSRKRIIRRTINE